MVDTLINLIDSLHEFEKKLLKCVTKPLSVKQAVDCTGLKEINVMRGAQWLSNKELILIKEDEVNLISLTRRGVETSRKGLPELRFLDKLKRKNNQTFQDLKSHSGLDKNEFNKSLGFCKKQGFISIIKGRIKVNKLGLKYLQEEEEKTNFLKKLSEEKTLKFKSLKHEELVKDLKKRGLITVEKKTERELITTPLGLKVLKRGVDLKKKLLEKNSEQLITSREWQRFKFRRYNVKEPVPKIYPGKKHFLYQVMEMIKRFFTEMGFVEMRSNYVESCFWNYDVMFFPQDHPDRGTMDTFYLDTKKTGKVLKKYAKIVSKVQEDGWKTGSKGRGLKWDIDEAKKLLLRCHTTQTTFRYLAKGLKPPYKFFSVDRVFRNETRDATHLPEFHQIEGFVVGEGLTFRNLIGNLKEFYNKMGIKKIKLKPTYNPYTEPSMEIHGYFPGIKKWKALGNSGVFRPEVLKPLGIDYPVIAWGLGLERIAMFLYDLDDVRQCLGHTVNFNTIKKSEMLTRIKK